MNIFIKQSTISSIKNIQLVLVALNNISYASAYSLHTSNILFNASRDGASKVISSALYNFKVKCALNFNNYYTVCSKHFVYIAF